MNQFNSCKKGSFEVWTSRRETEAPVQMKRSPADMGATHTQRGSPLSEQRPLLLIFFFVKNSDQEREDAVWLSFAHLFSYSTGFSSARPSSLPSACALPPAVPPPNASVSDPGSCDASVSDPGSCQGGRGGGQWAEVVS